ncbi:MAG: pyrimidine-nucleoside phosphorylase [Acholeplasmataceae bacterium]|nr:pyrimidine-nucleoside phosphorylase [Acholeplasmataceae bacterium]
MRMTDLITKKRDGETLSDNEIKTMISKYVEASIPDYQMSAFLMATYFQGMTDEESTALAMAMRDSGDVIDLQMLPGIKVDKHSTGGVGDKVTLVLGPLLASQGATFAKMSGRGLGHTGGTVDKLESIPGFRVELSVDEFIRQVQEIGIAVVGQSGDIAPADKKLYALRDVTATVDSIPLIASSIMSKKLASGADAIVLDVKVGHGAFMKDVEDATKLAKLMVNIGRLAGKHVTAVLTDMDDPLGHAIGNALEVDEAIRTLKGNGPSDLIDVTTTIGAYLLMDAKIECDFEVAKTRLKNALEDHSAYQIFEAFVSAQGGDVEAIRHMERLISKKTVDVLATESGVIESLDALTIGLAAMRLGAGRETKDDVILKDVGIVLKKKRGDAVEKGEPLAILHVQDQGVDDAYQMVLGAYRISQEPVAFRPLIKSVVRN